MDGYTQIIESCTGLRINDGAGVLASGRGDGGMSRLVAVPAVCVHEYPIQDAIDDTETIA